jgi:hypothetical protein
MTGERRSGGWRSDTVLAATVTAVAGVVVAIVGLFGGFGGGGGDDGPTPTVSPEPTISIKETTFAAGGAGTVTIRVTGSTTAFRSGDRLYAIARPQAVKRWWVSDPVVPLLGGDWIALIQASPGDGEQLAVSAVRIPAEELAGIGPSDVPTSGNGQATPPATTATASTPAVTSRPSTPAVTSRPSTPAETSRSSTPGGSSSRERIEDELRVSGEQARSVEVFSAPVAVLAPG